ncbi:unnamed protein product [Ilex paraguariensis]|uniref:Uncharacterized protein n=1 Tax=Ilex paraguariensis TaxID=185542 RepID=A0ABC8TS96_9AQUA
MKQPPRHPIDIVMQPFIVNHITMLISTVIHSRPDIPPSPPISQVNMEVQAEFMESSMAGSTSLSTPKGEVNSLMQQVIDNYGLEVSVRLPQLAAHTVAAKNTEKVDEDDLSKRLAELKARGLKKQLS